MNYIHITACQNRCKSYLPQITLVYMNLSVNGHDTCSMYCMCMSKIVKTVFCGVKTIFKYNYFFLVVAPFIDTVRSEGCYITCVR